MSESPWSMWKKTNDLVSCATCSSMLYKLSTKLTKLSARSTGSREACCERTLKRLRLHDLHFRIRKFAAAKARPLLTKPQKLNLNSDYETREIEEKTKKRKKQDLYLKKKVLACVLTLYRPCAYPDTVLRLASGLIVYDRSPKLDIILR